MTKLTFRIVFWTGLALAIGTAPTVAYPVNDNLEELNAFFSNAQIVEEPKFVDCTLSGGTETTCFSITVVSEPSSYTPGPWCPRNVDDGDDVSGIWLEDGTVHNADGVFMENLAEFYKDDKWQLFDPETGDINVTDSLEACLAAARPDVDEAYTNHCVECLLEYLPDDATQTYVIPVEPQPLVRGAETRLSGSGIASNGVLLDAPAPVDAILGAYTIAPFDDCGGHVNPHAGYHYHAATDCLENSSVTTEHGAEIGIAMDGYHIYSHLLPDGSEPEDLDRCLGHESEDIGYHYHAGAPGSNAILGCLSAEAGCHSSDPDAACDASARPDRP